MDCNTEKISNMETSLQTNDINWRRHREWFKIFSVSCKALGKGKQFGNNEHSQNRTETMYQSCNTSRDSLVVQCWATGWVIQAEAGNFFLHHRVQNGSGAHPASYPMGTSGSFAGGKAAGA
jgi:hypothetical protein